MGRVIKQAGECFGKLIAFTAGGDAGVVAVAVHVAQVDGGHFGEQLVGAHAADFGGQGHVEFHGALQAVGGSGCSPEESFDLAEQAEATRVLPVRVLVG